jgi:SAM-dependent methyltransferase
MHELEDIRIQNSYLSEYQSILEVLQINSSHKVLDIGSGLGFLKFLVEAKGASYTGIEPDRTSYESACALYGEDGFICGFFPDISPVTFYDTILVLSCVDEVPDKASFLSGLKSRLAPKDGVAYIAVRNKSFFVNRFKSEKIMSRRNDRSRVSLQDLSDSEWEALFANVGLNVYKRGKFWRPWLIGFTLVGIKNILYRILSIFLPREYSYMLYYIVKSK